MPTTRRIRIFFDQFLGNLLSETPSSAGYEGLVYSGKPPGARRNFKTQDLRPSFGISAEVSILFRFKSFRLQFSSEHDTSSCCRYEHPVHQWVDVPPDAARRIHASFEGPFLLGHPHFSKHGRGLGSGTEERQSARIELANWLNGQIVTYRNLDGIELRGRFYCAEGTMKAVVVALHGIQTHSKWYTPLAKELGQTGVSLFAIDRRGAGLNAGIGGIGGIGQLGPKETYHLWLEDISAAIKTATQYGRSTWALLEEDPAMTRQVSARFFKQTKKMRESALMHPGKIKIPILLLLAGKDQLMKNDDLDDVAHVVCEHSLRCRRAARLAP